MNKLSLVLLLIISFSCNKEKKQATIKPYENAKIISVVLDSIASYDSPRNLWPVPPPQNKFKKELTRKDSLDYKTKLHKYLDSFITIAIDTSQALYLPNYNKTLEIIRDRDIFTPMKQAYDSSSGIRIDISKIKLKRINNTVFYDSITYYSESRHLTKYRSYSGITFRFNFSKILYSENKSHAIIRYQQRFEDKYPAGGLFLLENEDNTDTWKIIDGIRFMSY